MGLIVFQFAEGKDIIEFKTESDGKTWKEITNSYYSFLKGMGYSPSLESFDEVIEEKCYKDDKSYEYQKDGTSNKWEEILW